MCRCARVGSFRLYHGRQEAVASPSSLPRPSELKCAEVKGQSLVKVGVTCRGKFHIRHICCEQRWKADTGNFVRARSCSSRCPGLFLKILPALCFNPAFHLRPQIVLVMRSRRTSRTSHSPLNHRRLPTAPQAAEETPPVASPASSWVESAFFLFFFQFFSFYFFKDKCPTALFLHIRPPPPSAALHLFHTHPSPHLLFVHPQTFCFYPFFLLKLKKTVKSTLCIFAPSCFSKISPSCSASRLLGKA